MLFLRAASGPQRTHLDGEGILRLRHWLQQAGITPDHPDAITTQAARGDQARRLLIHLDHKGARLWWLEGEEIHRAELIPHGLWSCGQRLSHRHDRDIAGQSSRATCAIFWRSTCAFTSRRSWGAWKPWPSMTPPALKNSCWHSPGPISAMHPIGRH